MNFVYRFTKGSDPAKLYKRKIVLHFVSIKQYTGLIFQVLRLCFVSNTSLYYTSIVMLLLTNNCKFVYTILRNALLIHLIV